jgi:hypothetical protein
MSSSIAVANGQLGRAMKMNPRKGEEAFMGRFHHKPPASESPAISSHSSPESAFRQLNLRLDGAVRTCTLKFMQSKQTVLLLLTIGSTLILSVGASAAEPGFKSLFNGTDLTGWEGNPKLWSVKDGAITGTTGSEADTKLSHNTFLVWTNGSVDDFEIRLRYRIERGNSGIQYRSKVIKHGPFGPIVGGYQADFEAGTTYSGILYEEQGRGILAQRGQKTVITDNAGKPKIDVTGSVGDSKAIQAKIKHEDWNDYVVIAHGNHLQHFINGQQTVDVIDEQEAKAAKSGVLALQIHQGPPMVVQFKDVRLKTLK